MSEKSLCGACQGWGYNPLIKNGKCTCCERTREQIIEDHGACELSAKELLEIRIKLGAKTPTGF